MLGLVAAGVADGPLALGVGPAGAVGDHLAVVADEQAADDLPDGACSWASVGWISPARMSWPRPRLLRVASAWRARASARRCSSSAGGVAEFVVVEAAPAKYASSRAGGSSSSLEVFVDEVDHEGGSIDPDAVGEVLAAVVDEGVAAVAGAVADLGGDPDLERSGPGAGGERVELAVELLGLAGEDRRELPRPSSVRWVRACSICSAASSSAPSSIRTA